MNRQRLIKPYVYALVAAGAAACLHASLRLPASHLDLGFFTLALVTVALGSRVGVEIPRIAASITVSDTFVFLIMLLYGGDAAVVVAAAEALCFSARRRIRPRTVFLNAALLALSTSLAACVWHNFIGQTRGVQLTGRYLLALCLMVLVQFAANSGLASIYEALKTSGRVFAIWRERFLWTSVTYVAGASGAAIIAGLVGALGFYSILFTLPVIGTIYFTYRTYLKQIELAEAQAEQARRHVAELSHYIAEQARIREQFVQVEKMSALGQLASGVAHDFNNCLAAILGRAELLARHAADERTRRGLEIIIKSAHDGARTVRRIQDFARQRRERDFQRVDVDQVLSDVAEMTRPRWKDAAEASGISITLALANRSRAFVMGDESELRDVLVNMIFNAVDAMPRGGALALGSTVEDGAVVVSVGDTGTGMSEEVRSRVFDPFFTTKGKAGMGLGLAVSYGIIRRHEGSVEVASEAGHGTTFTIRLPAATGIPRAGDSDPVSIDSQHPRAIGAVRPRVLVVDDEPHVRQLLCDIIEAEGCEAVTCASGDEAIVVFGAGGFDAVFTDIGMPGMNGWELSRAVRERDPEIPLAVITGWGESVGSDQQQAARVDWVVTKPFSMGRVAEILSAVSRRKESRAECDGSLVAA